MFDLAGKAALVTGAGQGVGAEIARVLAVRGAQVAVNDLYPERARETVESIRAQGGRAAATAFDVCDCEAVRSGVAQAEALLGPLDILVNSAGVSPGMAVERAHGRVITISSGAGTVGIPLGITAYGAGKGGGIASSTEAASRHERKSVHPSWPVNLIGMCLTPSIRFDRR